MRIRSIAPLRIGLAGGGTDVSPYSDIYGGAILNATVNMFAYATISPSNDGQIVLNSIDKRETISCKSEKTLKLDGKLDLLKGIYNRIVKDYTNEPLSFKLTTHVDAPPGSGLGSSSTLVTAIIGAFVEWLKIPFGEYDIANLAYQIERIDLAYAGGKQDQYAATFGGINFMEFYKDNKVIVNPLRIKSRILSELSYNMVLYYTGTSRISSDIISRQQASISKRKKSSIEAMHKTKEMAILMKEAILIGELDRVGKIMDTGWQFKKGMAEGITNPEIDKIYDSAIKSGATGGKISGAGGGGYMFFYCPGTSRYKVVDSLLNFGGEVHDVQFTRNGLESWTF